MKLFTASLLLAATTQTSGRESSGKLLRALSDVNESSKSMSMMGAAAGVVVAGSSKSGKSSKSSKALNQGTAARYFAPVCVGVTSSCTSGDTLQGVGQSESESPNTIDTCVDGNNGVYLEDESVEKITVSAVSGTELQAGRLAKIEAVVYAYLDDPSGDTADFFYTEDIENPSWEHIKSIVPSEPGLNTFEVEYRLPAGSEKQAVRVIMRYSGSLKSCTSGSYDDHDDLIFAVAKAKGSLAPTSSPILAPTSPPIDVYYYEEFYYDEFYYDDDDDDMMSSMESLGDSPESILEWDKPREPSRGCPSLEQPRCEAHTLCEWIEESCVRISS